MRMLRNPLRALIPTPSWPSSAAEKRFSPPGVSSRLSIPPMPCCSAQIQAPGSAELGNKASRKYFPLHVHFSLRALPEGRGLASKATNSCFWTTRLFACQCRGLNPFRVRAANGVRHTGITEWLLRSVPPFLAGFSPPHMPGFTG